MSGTVHQGSATSISLPSDSAAALVTDPPYFAAIPYADLSDFFYVWLRRGIGKSFPELFVDSLTQKEDELIVTNAEKRRMENRRTTNISWRDGSALSSARDVVKADGVGLIVYAEGTTAGWEAMLGAIIDSHWTVTSSWPIDTEMENRTQAHGAASLQSSIHIVCRPRVTDGVDKANEIGDWRDVLQELPKRIHEWMPRLADEGVVGADAIFACLARHWRYSPATPAWRRQTAKPSLCASIWSTSGQPSPRKRLPRSSKAPMPQALSPMHG